MNTGSASTGTTKPLSGREAALARRQALSKHGKTGAPAATTSSGTTTTSSYASTTTSAKTTSSSASSSQSTNTPAKAPTSGSTSNATSSSAAHSACDCLGATDACACDSKKQTATTSKPSAPLTPIAPSAAQKRRIEQSLKGRGDSAPSRPTGRTRPAPPKVEIGTTLTGNTVTGNQVERTNKVTGNEAGTCVAVTGTEYIGVQQYDQLCKTIPAPSAAKVQTTSTTRGQRVTGTEIGQSAKVTGEEQGLCSKVTGTEYLAAEHAASCGTTDSAKSSTRTGFSIKPTTAKENTGEKLTGTDRGSSQRVTGSDYLKIDNFVSFSREAPFESPAKKQSSITPGGQDVSGTQVGRSSKVTGDEHGACKQVTGSSYIGTEQFAEFCANRTTDTRKSMPPKASLGGDYTASCGSSAMAMHYRNESEHVSRTFTDSGIDAFQGARNLSKSNPSNPRPAMASRAENASKITGNAYDQGIFVTGPLARAAGLVSGTPDFRYGESRPEIAPAISAPASSDRITGEGRERTITGDAWDRGDRVTGTEGNSASRRNPTMRGAPGMARNKPEAPADSGAKPDASSRVTGSSGNSQKGATVTLSGGARG